MRYARASLYFPSLPSTSAAIEDTLAQFGVKPRWHYDSLEEAAMRERAARFDVTAAIEKIERQMMEKFDDLTDVQLVRWATNFGGWTYFYCNDQLRDPQGGLTTANNWGNIGSGRRKEIMEQMVRQANEKQLEFIKIEK